MRRILNQIQPEPEAAWRFLAILGLLVASISLQAQTVSFSGKAYELSSKKHVYTEYVSRKYQNGKIVSQYTLYKDPAGKTIGTKTLAFPAGPYLPTFRLDDQRDGYQEGAVVAGGSVQMYMQKSKTEPMEKKNFPVAASAVSDDGVDLFLRENLAQLNAGKALSFNLAVPNRWDWFKFTAVKSGLATRDGRQAISITMTLSNVLLRQLLPPIHFVYDLEKKTLFEFQGVSVLNGPDKKSYRVRTVYSPETQK